MTIYWLPSNGAITQCGRKAHAIKVGRTSRVQQEQPEGFHARGKEGHVLRLRRALYGLKQAGLAWWRALKKSMEELGFVNLDSDAGLFKCFDEASQTLIIAVVYVDDAIFLGPSKAAVEVMKKRFMERWESRDLGELKEFLHRPCCNDVEWLTPKLFPLLSLLVMRQ